MKQFMKQQESLNCDFEDVAEKFQLVEPLKQ